MNDAEIAFKAMKTLRPISELASSLGLEKKDYQLYGDFKAKIKIEKVRSLLANSGPRGKLILVSAMTPTPLGEGKTTVTIGLLQSLVKRGQKAIAALREPSLGPCFGIKGGAAGGGYSQVLPMEDINLHFTGDMHAVTTSHNLISALIDNYLFHEGKKGAPHLDVLWKRVMDMNDRALRHITVGQGKTGPERKSGFDITAASEIMAILCLSHSYSEAKKKIGNILLGTHSETKAPIFARDLKVEGAATALLKEALLPNLVQTIEGCPVLIHGGPFANIAQGANSIMATQLAMGLSDYTVTEAGFGFDLGGEKFFNIVSRYGGFAPSVVVIVATCRAIKHHGGSEGGGYANLKKHIENAKSFGAKVIVAINRFPEDTHQEVDALVHFCKEKTLTTAIPIDVWSKGGEGALKLADEVVYLSHDKPAPKIHHTYSLDDSVEDKIRKIATNIYGASDISFGEKAQKDLAFINNHQDHFAKLPICMAKTQSSLSDDPKLLGAPSNFVLHIREIVISSGAGFIVPITGEIMRMPGLPSFPAAVNMDIDDEGNISGLF